MEIRASHLLLFLPSPYYPPYSDLKFVSTLINPETPPMFGFPENPLIKLTSPCRPGVVPTSSNTQNSGFRYLQNPSKNQRCEDNLVPFVCLKHEKTRSPY